jgi:hypothetical protein
MPYPLLPQQPTEPSESEAADMTLKATHAADIPTLDGAAREKRAAPPLRSGSDGCRAGQVGDEVWRCLNRHPVQSVREYAPASDAAFSEKSARE